MRSRNSTMARSHARTTHGISKHRFYQHRMQECKEKVSMIICSHQCVQEIKLSNFLEWNGSVNSMLIRWVRPVATGQLPKLKLPLRIPWLYPVCSKVTALFKLVSFQMEQQFSGKWEMEIGSVRWQCSIQMARYTITCSMSLNPRTSVSCIKWYFSKIMHSLTGKVDTRNHFQKTGWIM